MTRPRTLSLCVSLVIASAACGGSSSSSTPGPASPPLELGLAFEPLSLPAPPGSGYGQLTSSKRGAVLSWLEQKEATTTLRFSELSTTGWSAARTVASGDNWFVTSADVPTVLRMNDGTLVANWYPATDASIEAYDTRLSYSRDDGATWARPFSPHHDGTKTQHGFASLLELSAGGLGLVWLDGREQELNTTDPMGGSMAVYFASFDRAWKQTAEGPVNARVCECCQTAVLATSDGILTAFRDRSQDEVRDIKVSRFDNGTWTAERSLHDDNWTIDACPVNGPALSGRGRQVAAAWFTAPNDKGGAFAAFSGDAGRTWGEPIPLHEEASLGHVDIELMEDGSAVASWVEFADGHSQVKVRRVSASGARSPAGEVPGAARVSGYPRMTRSGNELIFAWTESEGGQQLKGAVARPSRTTAP